MDCKSKIKRISLFMGHYGSGKTNIAVNYALYLHNQGLKTKVFDLDIVNPYFRTLDAKDLLKENQIELIASDYSNSNVDIPAITPRMYLMLEEDSYAVVDIGGDDRGAYALGRYQDQILAEDNYEVFLIINKYRIETRSVDDAIEIKNEIEAACKMKFTGIINNSHLGKLTTKETILESIDYANEISLKTGLPIRFTSIRSDLVPELEGKIENILPITLINYGDWN